MTLRTRLCLSYVAAIVLFCFAVAVVLWLLYPVPRGVPTVIPGHVELPPPVTRLLAQACTRGGLPEVERELRQQGAFFPPDAWLTIHRFDGTSEALLGEAAIGDPSEVASALRGNGSTRQHTFDVGFSMTAPVRDASGNVMAALSVEFGIGASPMRRALARSRLLAICVALACGLGLCTCLGYALSGAIVRPLRNLIEAIRRMSGGRLEERVPVEGVAEFVELSTRFNQLTEELERGLNDLRVQKEIAQRMESSRREFLADVSHNLRTPLTAIQGWLDALQDGLVTPEDTPRQMARIQREVGHVIRTVQHLLDLARWENEEPRLTLETFPVLEAVMDVAETLEEAATLAEVSLQFDEVSPSWLVRADRGKVREVFQILFENAVTYAGAGATVYLSMSPTASTPNVAEDVLEVVVRDNGVGIADDVIPHLRERYHRASSGGIGLGLAIVYKIVHAHGGRVEIESVRGMGTRVQFSLPFVGDVGGRRARPVL